MKKKFDVPLIVQVEAESMDDAEKIVSLHATHLIGKTNICQVSLGHHCLDNYNQRVIYLHPSDADADYDSGVYNARLDDERGDGPF